MVKTTLKAEDAVLEILRNAQINEGGLTLKGQLDRSQYEAVNKFFAIAGVEWNRKARRHTFRPGAKEKIEALLNNGELRDDKKHFQAFYTPTWLADELVSLADLRPGMDVLEPSAGEGAIALSARNSKGNVSCVELNPEDASKLKALGFSEIAVVDFLQVKPSKKFDCIVMNPPFTNDQDIKHVRHAFGFLKSGGLLVALMAKGWLYGESRIRKDFRRFIAEHGSVIRELPAGTFKDAGTNISTVIVRLEAS